METKIIKPGIQTTEFWATTLAVVGSTAASLQGVLDPKVATVLSVISTIAYTISRGLAKKQ